MQTIFPSVDLISWVKQIYGPTRRMYLTPYAYPLSIGDIAAARRVTGQLQITANADFVLMDIEAAVSDTSTSVGEDIKLLIADSATGEQFSNVGLYARLIGTTQAAQFSRNFPYPRWVGGNTSLSVEARAVGAVDNLVLTFNGMLIRDLT
jgi:hypothetical protein